MRRLRSFNVRNRELQRQNNVCFGGTMYLTVEDNDARDDASYMEEGLFLKS